MNSQKPSQCRKMREQFSVSIRKQKKQQIFQSYRSKLKHQFIQDEQQRMATLLDTRQKREEWLLSKAKDLTGVPGPSWAFTVNQLFWSLLCFKGKGCFKTWIETSTVKNLCAAFQQGNIHLGLAPEVAKLLGSVISLQQQEQQDKTSQITQQILQQNILNDLINLAIQNNLPHNQISLLMTLISNLAVTQHGQVIKSCGFTACVEWSMRMLRQNKINRAYLQQIYNFIHLLAVKLRKTTVKYNFSSQVLSMINEFVQLDQSPSLIIKMLTCLSIIVSEQKQAIYSGFLGFHALPKKVFQLSVHQVQIIRQLSWKVLSFLSSSVRAVGYLFEQNCYLDAVICAYEKQPKDSENFDKITTNMLICLGNMADQGDHMRQPILNSKAISIVIDSTHPERSTNLRKDAFYCLYNVITTKNYKLFKRIVFELPILQKLVIGLQTIKDKRTIDDILAAILHLVEVDRQVYKTNGEGILQIIQAKFNLSNILYETQEKYHKDVHINDKISSIYDMYSC